ncbi:MAG: hypothetical protein K9L17_11750 [Clostridiales bacterium]|nr:hypothetical protein [Clostridiales bacterium]MCF8023356.1 hypothetical protein [Clostridiales bacterium]
MKDPYKENMFKANPYYAQREITGRLAVVLKEKLENRGLQLMKPISRAVCKNDIHELIITDEEVGPGDTVQKIAYAGFFEVTSGGVIVKGNQVSCGSTVLGKIAGFDETHLPNHLNIVISSPKRMDGKELGLRLESEIRIKQIGDDETV